MKNRNYYEARLLKAINYINENLDKDLTVTEVAKESHFSTFHFQRIYRAILGETPYDTILRLRLERSVFLLMYEKKLLLADIANQVGFQSYENFSRQFYQRFQCSPSTFRKDKTLHNSRIYQEFSPNDFYSRIVKSREDKFKVFDVILEDLPNIKIALVKAVFGEDGSELITKYQTLIDWAERQKIPYQGPLKRFGMSLDNVEVTPASKYRYDFAVSTGGIRFAEEGLIESGEIPQGLYATIHCSGKLEVVAQAWDFLYKRWLPKSGFKPRNFPAIEEFIQGPEEIGWENFNLKCRIPIERL